MHRRRSRDVTAGLYDVVMGQVIDIRVWRRGRAAAVANHPSALAKVAAGSSAHARVAGTDDDAGERELDMLERAVKRLHPMVSKKLDQRRPLEGDVETELLAIMGELSVGLVREATRRADRLAERLKDAGKR
jgi:hypothetical protein